MKWFLCLLFIAAAGAAVANDSRDRTIAQNRIGAVTGSSTSEQLRRIYGSANVRVGQHDEAGEAFEGIIIFRNKPDEVRIVFSKDKKRNESAEVGSRRATWRTAEGLRIGSSLEDTERINGGPITLQYTELTGGGFASQEKKGKLLGLHLQFRITGKLSNREEAQLKRNSVQSDNPLIRKAKLRVSRILVPFDPQ